MAGKKKKTHPQENAAMGASLDKPLEINVMKWIKQQIKRNKIKRNHPLTQND